ncbi:glycoside hydrolase family 2 protein [Patiriisocius sp. Uisw_017]|uniref:glycoside hydrolase family 2 protein n=1 Tax=Patiriisocius sp. Uisw_017 TaxID=3230968 RepID=UPI0039E74956
MKLKWGLIFLSSLLINCKQSTNSIQSLNGNDWQFTQDYKNPNNTYDIVNWQPATVPGSVQKDLLNLGRIPDPFKGSNEDSIQWVSERSWIYKKEFSVSAEILKKQKHILRFEGLNTYAHFLFNNKKLTKTNNAFRIWEVDVSDLIETENAVEITFYPTDEYEEKESAKLNYTLPESPRVFTRKPQFQYGWDWGPTIKTMGIWRDVSLVSYDQVRMKDAFVQTNTVSEEKAMLTANIEFETFDYDKSSIEIVNNTTNETIANEIEIYGNDTYKFPIIIDHPKLWWTHNLGEPFLYDFTINVKKGNTVIQSINKKVGIRTIELVTEKDSIGEGFYFELNGKPVYMKGANYIPQNIFLADVLPKERKKLLDDVVAANMNMLRVWGGGVYEEDLFYDLCDEKGILIWQDFMFACAMYPGDAAFLENVKGEAIDTVKRLRQHPSIALYCGNNENREGWHRWGWQADKTEAQKEEIWNNYQAIFNDMLPKVVDNLSPAISYWESSPKFGRGDKRYQLEGDAHDWWVWHDGYPFEHFEEEVPRFMSEFGFQSFPSYEAIKYFTEQDSIDLNHPSFTTHQKHARGYKLIREYMEREFPVPTNPEDYVYVSQLLQAYGITKGIFAHRRAKPYNMGTLYWQLNDCWPVVSWSSIDGMGNWKALHFKAREAFKNRLIVPFEENNILKISIVDDAIRTITADLLVLFKDFNGEILAEFNEEAISTFNEKNEVIFEIPLHKLNIDRRKSYAEIFFGNDNVVHYFEKPKNLNLSTEKLTAEMVKKEYGYEIRLHSETLQKDVFLYSEAEGTFENNFIDVLPNRTENIKFKTEIKAPLIKYKTLNQINNTVNNAKNKVSVIIELVH